MNPIFPPAAPACVPVYDSTDVFPVHRIYCVGRNYAEHAREMGATVDRSTPVFFCKPADAIVTGDRDVPYPSATTDLHHEVEMVVALHSGGRDIAIHAAMRHVFGYAVGLDLTRRDLQAAAKTKGMPWDTAKAFDHSAPISALRRTADAGDAHLSLEVNGALRQQTSIADMVFDVAEIIHELSKLFELRAGDLIFTGTPAGVAALARGDRFVARLGDIAELRGRIV